jgi:hypothetical protein
MKLIIDTPDANFAIRCLVSLPKRITMALAKNSKHVHYALAHNAPTRTTTRHISFQY